MAESPYPKCGPPQDLTLEQLEAIAKLPAEVNKAGVRTHPAMLPLFDDMVLRYTGGNYHNAPIHFRLHVPEKLEKGKKYPMVVWLHGAGECGSDNIDQLAHLHHIIPYLTGPKQRDFFLLVPQCPHSHVSWEAPEKCFTIVRPNGTVQCQLTDDPIALGNAPISFTIAMIEAVAKAYPVDTNRITVAGLSTGGEGVWKILERRPDLFAAAVPIVSWQAMRAQSLKEKPLLKKIPIWAIYSSDDRAIDFARKEFERMKESGCRVKKTEFGVCGHRAWTPAMLQGDIFGWLITRAKDGEKFYAAETSATGPEKIGIFADVTEGDQKKKPTPAADKKKAEPPREQAPNAKQRRAKATKKKSSWLFSPTRPRPPRPTPPPAAKERREATMPRGLIDGVRMELVLRYLQVGDADKAFAVANKIEGNKPELIGRLLTTPCGNKQTEIRVLDYIDQELDRMERRGDKPTPPRYPTRSRGVVPRPHRSAPTAPAPPKKPREPSAGQQSLEPIPAGKKNPMDECGKEWSMSTTTEYGLFPSGWEKEASNVPPYVVNETGKQLRARLDNAFNSDDLAAMKAICNSFIKLDDVPLSSPWFDTSGGRLKGRIKYTLNEKAVPVVSLLRDIACVHAESKKKFVDLAKRALDRVDKITKPKQKEQK